MPPKPMNFSKTVIYKICCRDLTVTDVYVGSTTHIVKRRCNHKSRCANETGKHYNLQVYRFIRANGGFENWDVIVIEEFRCENSEQARTRERFWLEQLGATLNSRRPIETKQDVKDQTKKYYTEHTAELKEQVKKYRTEHAAEIKAQQAERITCQCGVEHSRGNKAIHLRTAKHVAAMAAL